MRKAGHGRRLHSGPWGTTATAMSKVGTLKALEGEVRTMSLSCRPGTPAGAASASAQPDGGVS